MGDQVGFCHRTNRRRGGDSVSFLGGGSPNFIKREETLCTCLRMANPIAKQLPGPLKNGWVGE